MESDTDSAAVCDAVHMGSAVRISGKFRDFQTASNPGEFDAKEYYTLMGISGSVQHARLISEGGSYDHLRELLWRTGRSCAGVYEACMEQNDASIMKAMLLGQRGDMDTELKNLYSRAGIAHVLAISGLHISLIGTGIYQLLRRMKVPIPFAACAGMLFLSAYTVMTGNSASSFRATCMFLLYLLAQIVGRTYDMVTALAAAAALLLLQQPLYLYHTGFQMSFAAVLGIAYLTPLIRDMKEWGSGAAGKLWNAFCASLGVFLAALPIQLFAYYSVSVYSICLNLLIIPCMSILLCAGGAGLLIGLCSQPAGALCLRICHYILLFYEKSGSFTLSLPHGVRITGRPAIWQIIGYYSLLLAALYAGKQSRSTNRNRTRAMAAACIGIAVILLTARFETGGMRITFLDIGQGDAIAIHSETGHTYLIDGGSSSNSKMAEYQYIPYLKYNGVDTIDCAFITHLDEDHYNALRQLLILGRQESIRVARIVLSEAEIRDETYWELCETAEAAGVSIAHMRRGESIQDGKLTIQCIYPTSDTRVTDRNDASLVLTVRYEAFLALLMGDLGEKKEAEVIEQIARLKEETIDYTLLKAAHHGSQYSGGRAFLACVQPDMTVISCGENNRYGHPHAETLERLSNVKSRIYITYETGAVTVRVKKKRVYARTYKY